MPKTQPAKIAFSHLKPIANLAAFKSGVSIHQLTAPAVQSVELFCILEDATKTAGYLLLHVPASSIAGRKRRNVPLMMVNG